MTKYVSVPTVICPGCRKTVEASTLSDGVCQACARKMGNPLSTRRIDRAQGIVAAETQKSAEQMERDDRDRERRLLAEQDRVAREREEEFNREQEAQKELARREAARRNLLPFVMYFNDDYMPGWVHADICRHLEQFSRDVVEKKSPRLMLFMPPRTGKTELASKTFPAWHLGHNPTHDIICCSYSAALAVDISRKCRGIVQDERYRNIFPGTHMDEGSQSAERWNTARNYR